METAKKNTGSMQESQVEFVLKEMLEEQKEAAKTSSSIIEAINHLSGKVSGFEEKLQNLKVTAPPIDTKEFRQILSRGLEDISIKLSMRPGTVTKKLQILLFPEQDAKLFYRIIFSRWLLGLMLAFLITNIYSLAVHWTDNQKEIDLRRLESVNSNKTAHKPNPVKNRNFHSLTDSVPNLSLEDTLIENPKY